MSQDGHTALCAIILWVCIILQGCRRFQPCGLPSGQSIVCYGQIDDGNKGGEAMSELTHGEFDQRPPDRQTVDLSIHATALTRGQVETTISMTRN